MRKNISLFVFALCAIACLRGIAQAAAPEVKEPEVLRNSGEVYGQVEICGGISVDGTLVHLLGRSFSVRTGASGFFSINYVPEGDHVLVIAPENVAPMAQPITVSRGTITDVGVINFCEDQDNDGFSVDTDCNDNNPNIFPGAQEICDGQDNDCNGQVDDGAGCITCTDGDNDGFFAQAGCSTLVDCDDGDDTVNPGALESCDSKDNNCDGIVDEGFDADNDGFSVCAGDCNDNNPQIFPSAQEVCDGQDNNCNNTVDENNVCGCSASEVDCDGICTALTGTPQCGTAPDAQLSSISGDTGADITSISATGGKLFTIQITENDSGIVAEDLGVFVQLSVPAGTDYDLRVWCDGCGTSSGQTSTSSGSVDEQVYVWWEEDTFIGVPTGSDSGRTLWIRVDLFNADVCDEWTLSVSGNRFSGSASCSAK